MIPSSTMTEQVENPYPLAPLVDRWKSVIAAAKTHRKKEFDAVADEARQFFDGETNWMWKQIEQQRLEGDGGFLSEGAGLPQFKISINRMFDAVAMFGPALYHQNPTIAVSTRPTVPISIETFYGHDPQAAQLVSMIPAIQSGQVGDAQMVQLASMLQQQYDSASDQTSLQDVVNRDHAVILQQLSNYVQNEGHKQDEARDAITEAIITGLGLLEIVSDDPPAGGPKLPASKFLSNRDFFCDPDATYWKDVTWIAIRRVSPVNVVERKFGLQPGSLKGKIVSNSEMKGESPQSKRRHGDGLIVGKSHDLVEYYDVYSKNGAGQRLATGGNKQLPGWLDSLGDFVHLVICPGTSYPLNMPPSAPAVDPMTGQVSMELLEATAWPAPFWDDHKADGGWPVVRLTFYKNPGKLWPISMCKPCIGEMRFINWIMSFLADGIAAGSKIYPAVLKSAASNLREQLESGSLGPFKMLELEAVLGKERIQDLITFLQAPSFNFDIWRMLEEVNNQIDKRLGLTELMYGQSSRQMRSAAEAQYRQTNINIRPDDMASKVEDWLSLSATREIQMLRWTAGYEDVEPIVGPVAAQVFAMQILTRDVSAITREFKFRVEAGTARKPNRDTQIAQMTDIGQYLLPVIQSAMQAGVTRPFNAYMEDLARAMDMDVSRYQLNDQDQQLLAMYQQSQMQPSAPPEEVEEAA